MPSGSGFVRSGKAPLVILNLEVGRADSAIRISCDHQAGGRLAADTLLDDGHQRIAYLAGIPGLSNNEDRKRGFLQRLEEAGRKAWAIEEGDRTYQGGFAVASRVLDARSRPDALFCDNDMLAIGALDAARHRFGLRVPEDIAVLGVDDIPMANWPTYSLSTIRQPMEPMVAAATDLIEHLPRGADVCGKLHLFPAELIRRGTTRAGR